MLHLLCIIPHCYSPPMRHINHPIFRSHYSSSDIACLFVSIHPFILWWIQPPVYPTYTGQCAMHLLMIVLSFALHHVCHSKQPCIIPLASYLWYCSFVCLQSLCCTYSLVWKHPQENSYIHLIFICFIYIIIYTLHHHATYFVQVFAWTPSPLCTHLIL